MWLRIRHVKCVRSRRSGKVYFYHRLTGERLPNDPEARARRALEINAKIDQDARWAAWYKEERQRKAEAKREAREKRAAREAEEQRAYQERVRQAFESDDLDGPVVSIRGARRVLRETKRDEK